MLDNSAEKMTGEMLLDIKQIGKSSLQQLKASLATVKCSLILQVPLPSINFSRSNLDVASDYLDALFVGESIAPFCHEISDTTIYEGHRAFVHFVLFPQDVEGLATKLFWLSNWYNDDLFDDESQNAILDEFRNALVDFETELEERNLYLPELADLYLANRIIGEYPDEEAAKESYSKYPEHKYVFWKSFWSKKVGFDSYVSPFCCFFPREADIKYFMERCSGFRQTFPVLKEVNLLAFGNLQPIIYNPTGIFYFPSFRLREAQLCAEEIWLKEHSKCSPFYEWHRIPQEHCQDDLRHDLMQFFLRREHSPIELASYLGNSIEKVSLSDDGEIMVVVDRIAQYVFFSDYIKRLNAEGAQEYLNRLGQLSIELKSLTGDNPEIALPWNSIDDDQFEELCYDVVRCMSKCNTDTIRKMGKSRSRDGGRDIEFYSHERLGKQALKWVVQCKLITDGSSLTTRKMQFSDMIDQYAAGGFCVMTSGVIDSGLHDRMSDIGRNRKVDIDEWDRLRLERFLAQRPEIRDRYFRLGK